MANHLITLIFWLIGSTSYAQTYSECIQLGDNNLTSKNYQEAIRLYSKSISIDSSQSEAYLRLGQAYLYSEKDKEAIENFDKAIKLNPTDPNIYFLRAQSLGFLNDKYVTLADYAKAIELDTNYVEAYVSIAYVFLSLGILDGAFVFFTKAIKKDSNQRPDVYF